MAPQFRGGGFKLNEQAACHFDPLIFRRPVLQTLGSPSELKTSERASAKPALSRKLSVAKIACRPQSLVVVMDRTMPQIVVLGDADAIAREAAKRIVEIAEACIELNGRFSIALSGGSTPKKLYDLLASKEFRDQIDWPKVEIFFGDERCVPQDHSESNYRMARETLLSKVPIPGDNV